MSDVSRSRRFLFGAGALIAATPLLLSASTRVPAAEKVETDGPVRAFELDVTGELRFSIESARKETWYRLAARANSGVDVHQLSLDILRWSKSDGFRVVAVGEAVGPRTGESSAKALELVTISVGLGR